MQDILLDDFLALSLFAVSTAITPGPNNFMIMNSGMHFGIRRSIPHLLGIGLGFPIMVFSVSLGLGNVFTSYPALKTVLKVLGSAYMLYMAWGILRSEDTGTKKTRALGAKPLTFWQAALFQWINPKALIMAIGVTSVFSLLSDPTMNALVVSLTYALFGAPSITAWLLFGVSLQKILKNDGQRRLFNLVMALSLVASIGLIFWE